MDTNQVGETAGAVWKYLRENGASSLSSIEKNVKTPKPVVHMAIGWLAREGKVEFAEENRTVRLSLKEG